jgi:predicted hotdog family 3-hydroxylacyl-ACP dehydratase
MMGQVMSQMRDHAWILSHIPHQGSMCVLDRIVAWSEDVVHCSAASHRDLDNPLRARGQLAAACGIEYAAQAMAVHGALLAPAGSAAPRVGYLVSVRATQLHVARLDNIPADLLVVANCITRNENNILYQFSVSAAGQALLDGRATVIVNAEALA